MEVCLDGCVSWLTWLHHTSKGITGLCENMLWSILWRLAVGGAVEGLGGLQSRTCVRMSGWVCEGFGTIWLEEEDGMRDSEPVGLALCEVQSEVT